jgi:hypothetical protein
MLDGDTDKVDDTDMDGGEVEDMEEDANTKSDEFGEISVVVPQKSASKEVKESKPAKPAVTSEEALSSIVTKGSNIQANKQMKDLQKSNKKRRKRANKISDALGDSLLSAMNFTAGEGESEAMSTDVNDASTLFV